MKTYRNKNSESLGVWSPGQMLIFFMYIRIERFLLGPA